MLIQPQGLESQKLVGKETRKRDTKRTGGVQSDEASDANGETCTQPTPWQEARIEHR